ncbi:hypothetical protein L2E81_06215 [Planktothrix agardhii 1033]|nr:hypothetical protein [Planktothrix agardhii 1033]
MLIPHAENAVVDIRKLRDYCLNLEHDDGKHKARLFSSILGMTADDAEELRQILLEVVKTQVFSPVQLYKKASAGRLWKHCNKGYKP